MATKKILFFVLAGILGLGLIFSLWKITHTEQSTQSGSTGSLSIWIVGDTTIGYDTLIEGFRTYAPEYKKTTIEFRKFSDYASYQKMLLSTLADGKGPDIFMVDAGADALLQSKVEPIPTSLLHISDFDKRFEDLFLTLIESSGTTDATNSFLRWVPLWYEALGMFYNKSLLTQIPKTWNEVSMLYTVNPTANVFPTNIGMTSRYTPYSLDILWLFLVQSWIREYNMLDKAENTYENFSSFATTPIPYTNSEDSGSEDQSGSFQSLWDMQNSLSEKKLTTIDLFMRWKIAFIVGYPSLIHELEDAKKRAWIEGIKSIILTEKIPQSSFSQNSVNLARYSYFGISKSSQNGSLWVKFLDYLLTEDAERRFLSSFPNYIPAQRSFYETSKSVSLSTIFSRAKLDSFIPWPWEELQLFDYGNKIEFEKILTDNIDRNGKIDKDNISKVVISQIWCEVHSISGDGQKDGCVE